MRALLLTTICLFGLLCVLQFPFLGVMMWHWLSMMNPHRIAYGFTLDLPIILITAIVTLVMWLASSEPKRIPMTWASALMLAFVLWFTLTMVFGVNPDAYAKWDESVRVFVMIFVTMAMTNSRIRTVALVWVCAVSIGYYGIKGGVFSILTGGAHRILGPTASFFADNNQCGLALLMIMPLWLFLTEQTKHRTLKLGLMGLTGLIIISIALTYSRGALVGLAVVGLAIWLTSRRKVLSAAIVAAALFVAVPLIPEQWYKRMQTIETYEEDQSAGQRLKTWGQGWQMAVDRPLMGYGFKAYLDKGVYERYRAQFELDRPREAHSIYFQVLGEQGFVGLGIFLGIGFFAFRTARRVYKLTKGVPEMFWANRLSRALLLCFMSYYTSGAFLSVAYFDLHYFLVTLVICLHRVVTTGEVQPAGRVGLFDWLRPSPMRPSPAPAPAPAQRA
jgi:putative inorganic carbon (hco3(-)) transporter